MKKVIALLALSVLFCMESCEEDGASDETSSFKDPRDGKKYKFVKTGNQTWMAQNLDYHGEDGNLGSCYGKKPKNCKKYGRLYDWDEAMKACPSGWHLPSGNEWQTLVDFAGGNEIAGKKLKAKSEWNDECKLVETCGTDEYGFSALPGGYGYSDDSFDYVGHGGNWWSADEGKDEYYMDIAYIRGMGSIGGNAEWFSKSKSYLFSIRCVQD